MQLHKLVESWSDFYQHSKKYVFLVQVEQIAVGSDEAEVKAHVFNPRGRKIASTSLFRGKTSQIDKREIEIQAQMLLDKTVSALK